MTWQIEISGLPTARSGAPIRFSVEPGSPHIVIGRDARCDVQLDDDLVAGQHCRIVTIDGKPRLENLDEEMGTIVDGEVIATPISLEGEHSVEIATVALTLRVTQSGVARRTPEESEPDPPDEPAPEPDSKPDREPDQEPASEPQRPDAAAAAVPADHPEPAANDHPGFSANENPPGPSSHDTDISEAEPGYAATPPPNEPTPAGDETPQDPPASDPEPEPEHAPEVTPEPAPVPEDEPTPSPEPEPEPEHDEGNLDDILAAAAALAGGGAFADDAPEEPLEQPPTPDDRGDAPAAPEDPPPLTPADPENAEPKPAEAAPPVEDAPAPAEPTHADHPIPESPATQVPEPEPEPEPEPIPTRQSAQPDELLDTLDPDVAGALRSLREDFDDASLGLTSPDLRATLEPIVARARELGFTGVDHIAEYLRCVVLVGDDLLTDRTATQDLRFTLSHTTRPPEQRLRRAVKIAAGTAEATGPAGMPASAAAPPRAASPRKPAEAAAKPAPPAAPATPKPPEGAPNVDGYSVFEAVPGQPGVYRAHAGAEQTEVLLQRVEFGASMPEDMRAELTSRAKAAAAVSHPNLLRRHRVVLQNDGLIAVSDAVTGQSATETMRALRDLRSSNASGDAYREALAFSESPPEADRLLTSRHPDLALSLHWIADLATALHAAHQAGIAHRDLTPSAAIVAASGHALLTNLGLRLPAAGRWGTPPYAAPERLAQWITGADLTPEQEFAADLWSLGAILYDLLCARPIYAGTAAELIHATIARDPDDARTHRADLPDAAASLSASLLQRDPRARPASAGEVAERARDAIEAIA